jgi:hypothetical protein
MNDLIKPLRDPVPMLEKALQEWGGRETCGSSVMAR